MSLADFWKRLHAYTRDNLPLLKAVAEKKRKVMTKKYPRESYKPESLY
jgi:hypothetical protein